VAGTNGEIGYADCWSCEVSEDPYIDTLRCTSCNDCMKVNAMVFQYDE